MKAIPGGKATHDTMDAPTIALLRRGGRLPQASVYPAMRATRDLLRRRMPLARIRGALLAPVQPTTSHDHMPALGHKIADQAHRDGVAARVAEPAGPKRLAIALARIGSSDAWLRDLALAIVTAARPHDANTRSLLRPVPGMGKILRLVWLDDIHDMARFPRVPEWAAYGRLVTCAQASAGKRYGTSGTNIGQAHLPWAFSEAAV
jgi:transposase